MADFYTNLSNFLTGFDEDNEASTKRTDTLKELRRINIQLKAINEQLNTKTSLPADEVEKLKSKKEELIARQKELNEVKDTYNNTKMASAGRFTKDLGSKTGKFITNNSNIITEPAQAGAQGMFIGLGNWAANNRTKATAPDRASAHLQQQATMHDVQSGDLQKNAQQAAQIANRDYHTEAEKNAVAGAATENAQRVQNLSASAGAGAAALNRQVKSADYNTMMNRADTQRDKAAQYNKEAWDVRQVAEQERAGADRADYLANEANTANRYANLALGASYGTNKSSTEQNPVNESNPKQTVSEPEQSTSEQSTLEQPGNTGGWRIASKTRYKDKSVSDEVIIDYIPYQGDIPPEGYFDDNKGVFNSEQEALKMINTLPKSDNLPQDKSTSVNNFWVLSRPATNENGRQSTGRGYEYFISQNGEDGTPAFDISSYRDENNNKLANGKLTKEQAEEQLNRLTGKQNLGGNE